LCTIKPRPTIKYPAPPWPADAAAELVVTASGAGADRFIWRLGQTAMIELRGFAGSSASGKRWTPGENTEAALCRLNGTSTHAAGDVRGPGNAAQIAASRLAENVTHSACEQQNFRPAHRGYLSKARAQVNSRTVPPFSFAKSTPDHGVCYLRRLDFRPPYNSHTALALQ